MDELQTIETARRESWKKLRLRFSDPVTLPESLGDLTDLEELSIYVKGLTALPESMGRLVNLRKFEIQNHIVGAKLTELPESLGQLANLRELRLPAGWLKALPKSIGQLANLEVLYLPSNGLTTLPESIGQLTNLRELCLTYNIMTALPDTIGQLANLQKLQLDHNRLTVLPESIGQLANLQVLDLRVNPLTGLPESIGQLVGLRTLSLSETPVTALPVLHVDMLGISECRQLVTLSDGTTVRQFIELADTALTQLPSSLQDTRLYWDYIPIDQRIAFHPETLTAQEILAEPNHKRRGVMLERLGYAAFIRQTQPTVLDTDQDARGERRLLRIDFKDAEPLVCLDRRDPITGHQYLRSVPKEMTSCQQAAAWIADFDNPGDY